MTEKNRVQDFLNLCNNEISSADFITEKKIEMDRIITSPDFDKELQIHNALASKQRLLIIKILEQGEQCNCTLARILDLSKGSISHHLNKMSNAGIIVAQKKGHFTMFYTKENFIKKLG